jgi:hypothetical protein
MSSHTLWFATRGAGVVSLLLLTAIVAMGVAGATRWRSSRWPRFVVAGLHRSLSLLALVFIVIHVITTVADGYAPISIISAVLPFTSAYRPIWLGLGAVAFDLLLALVITSLVRARIGLRAWRVTHWLAYASWPIALVHGLGTGTDARLAWMRLLTIACLAVVGGSVLWRVSREGTSPATRGTVTVCTLALPLVIGGWYLSGPGAAGWASRAGTPRTLLARPVHPVAKPVASAPRAPTLPTSAFSATFTGRVRQTEDAATGRVLVDITGRTSGGGAGRLWIRLQGDPVASGGVAMTASGARYGPASFPNAYVGKIVELEGDRIVLSLRSHVNRLSMLIDLQLDAANGAATGTVHARPTRLQ